MNDLTITNAQIPTNFEDLSKFVLIGREKLTAVRAEIRAIDKVGLAEEVRKQKLEEAQDISEAVLDAEVKIGELMAKVPKASGRPSKNIDSGVENKKTKADAIKDAGFTQKQAERFQTLASNPDIVEQAKAEARENDDIVSRSLVLNMVKEKKREEQRKEKAERKAYELDDEMPDDVCKLFVADICDGLPEIADESIDYIITDPPYPAEYIPLYGELSKVAARVLKQNGSLIVMCGQSYLPQVIDRLRGEMNYHWCMAYVTPGGQSPSLFQKKVNTFWKPVLWFTKGKYNGDYIGDVLKSPVNANDKRYHEWGQSLGGMQDIVEKFTDAGQLILDPFLGGGTTGVAAVTMGRKFIGTDIDKKNIDISMERIKESYQDARSKSRAD